MNYKLIGAPEDRDDVKAVIWSGSVEPFIQEMIVHTLSFSPAIHRFNYQEKPEGNELVIESAGKITTVYPSQYIVKNELGEFSAHDKTEFEKLFEPAI